MSKLIDIIGQRFGQLVVIAASRKSGRAAWLCQCDCGGTCVTSGTQLRSGKTHTCDGPAHVPYIDMVGKKFGRLLVVKRSGGKHSSRNILWECLCECGETVTVPGSVLRSGKARSCGCFRSENLIKRLTTHGKWQTRTYRVWAAIIQRCTNHKHKHFGNYGKRGIAVCEGWRKFENFYTDMGERPDNKTIDRIDNDDGYHCGHCDDCKSHGWTANCRWATPREQGNNTSRNRHISIDGQVVTVKQASEITGVKYGTILTRLNKGLSDEDAIKPAKKK